MDWKPIEKYDALKRKPKGPCIFWFKATEPTGRGMYLSAAWKDSRSMGSRTCTHWAKITPPEDQ